MIRNLLFGLALLAVPALSWGGPEDPAAFTAGNSGQSAAELPGAATPVEPDTDDGVAASPAAIALDNSQQTGPLPDATLEISSAGPTESAAEIPAPPTEDDAASATLTAVTVAGDAAETPDPETAQTLRESSAPPASEDNADSSPPSIAADALEAPDPETAPPVAETPPPTEFEESAVLSANNKELPEDPVSDEEHFPTSPVIERQMTFWMRIFTEISSKQGLIHDGALTVPVYEKLELQGMKRRAQTRYVKRRKREVTRNLRQLAADLEQGRTPSATGSALLALMPPSVTPAELRQSAREVRFQRGLADRFERGLVESGSYLQEIRRILKSYGVPMDLSYLPHVESSFNYRAYSKFGAAGIWQFTRGTAKMFMKVQYEVDERLDPLIATRAAAKFLLQNYKRLGSWPLAITAYNHGPNSMSNIVKRMGTRDLGELIRNYHGRLFKFASKNFYAEFLAARKVANNPEKYFRGIRLNPPLAFKRVKLPFFVAFHRAAEALGVETEILRQMNPGLRRPVLLGDKHIPRGYELRVPHQTNPQRFIGAIPPDGRSSKQKRTWRVRVRRGDTLYAIGRRLNVPWPLIARANNISRYNRIRPGQRLIIPGAGAPPPVVAQNKPDRVTSVATVSVDGASRPRRAAAPRSPRAPRDGAAATIDAFAYQPAEGPAIFPDLGIQSYYRDRQEGVILAAFGETLGHYGEWANVPANEIRTLNYLSRRAKLKPGRTIHVPLDRVSLEEFIERRTEYHKFREEDFYSSYGIAELERVKVKRGQTLWAIAQNNGMPMWLLYRENPQLINNRLRAGMHVKVPVIEGLEILKSQRTSPSG